MKLFAKLCKIVFSKINSKLTEDYEENENRAFFSARKKFTLPQHIFPQGIIPYLEFAFSFLFLFCFLYYGYFAEKKT